MHRQPDEGEEVRRLFHEHVPQVASGVVEIKGIARMHGQRTILAVHSTDSSVDPVGSCVGERGIHVKAIVQQLSGEKIDIVRWSDSVEEFIRNLLAPARAERIILDGGTHRATIYASPDLRSLIIGRHGSTLEMMSQLAGWDIQIVDT
jgi:N utilization substance protein A